MVLTRKRKIPMNEGLQTNDKNARGGAACSENLVQNEGFKGFHPFKDWIIGNQSGGFGVFGGRCLQRIR